MYTRRRARAGRAQGDLRRDVRRHGCGRAQEPERLRDGVRARSDRDAEGVKRSVDFNFILDLQLKYRVIMFFNMKTDIIFHFFSKGSVPNNFYRVTGKLSVVITRSCKYENAPHYL